MLSKNEIYKYTGDVSQVFYARKFRFAGGKADGMLAVDINNGAGLQFTVLADRAMDIADLSYKGINFSYITKAGYAHPAYFDGRGDGFKKTFTGGFLTTCGMTQAGAPCESDGEELGLHGHLSSLPAEDFCCEVDMDKDVPEIVLKGKMRYAYLFGYNLWLTREIRVRYGENRIYIKDIAENRDGNPAPYMMLYHFNMGYSLLDENAVFQTSAQFLRSRDDEARKGESKRAEFQKPELNFKEQVFYYKSAAAENGKCFSGLYNEKLKTGLKIWIDPAQLPNVVQWKNPGYSDYVMGIEPANCFPEGREKQKEYGLEHIPPYESRRQDLEIEVY